MIRNVGFPSVVAATFWLISTPRISRPSSVRCGSEKRRTSVGFELASVRSSLL
jgi:hypothetical protein